MFAFAGRFVGSFINSFYTCTYKLIIAKSTTDLTTSNIIHNNNSNNIHSNVCNKRPQRTTKSQFNDGLVIRPIATPKSIQSVLFGRKFLQSILESFLRLCSCNGSKLSKSNKSSKYKHKRTQFTSPFNKHKRNFGNQQQQCLTPRNGLPIYDC